jgi:hypothetical protein
MFIPHDGWFARLHSNYSCVNGGENGESVLAAEVGELEGN